MAHNAEIRCRGSLCEGSLVSKMAYLVSKETKLVAQNAEICCVSLCEDSDSRNTLGTH